MHTTTKKGTVDDPSTIVVTSHIFPKPNKSNEDHDHIEQISTIPCLTMLVANGSGMLQNCMNFQVTSETKK